MSQVVICEYDRTTGKTHRQICPECVAYVREFGQVRALDPEYFWGAGVFNYQTVKTPEGTKAYINPQGVANYLFALPLHVKSTWQEQSFAPFPYKFLKNRKRSDVPQTSA